jgi:hypothetical protein
VKRGIGLDVIASGYKSQQLACLLYLRRTIGALLQMLVKGGGRFYIQFTVQIGIHTLCYPQAIHSTAPSTFYHQFSILSYQKFHPARI